MEPIYTPKEVAAMLKVTEKSIMTWLRKRQLKGIRAGRLWRVRESDLQEFLERDVSRQETIQRASR